MDSLEWERRAELLEWRQSRIASRNKRRHRRPRDPRRITADALVMRGRIHGRDAVMQDRFAGGHVEAMSNTLADVDHVGSLGAQLKQKVLAEGR